MSATTKDMNVTLNAVQLTCATARLRAEVKVKVGKIYLELSKMQCNASSCTFSFL